MHLTRLGHPPASSRASVAACAAQEEMEHLTARTPADLPVTIGGTDNQASKEAENLMGNLPCSPHSSPTAWGTVLGCGWCRGFAGGVLGRWGLVGFLLARVAFSCRCDGLCSRERAVCVRYFGVGRRGVVGMFAGFDSGCTEGRPLSRNHPPHARGCLGEVDGLCS